MGGKYTVRKAILNRADTAITNSVKIIHEIEEIQKAYGDREHKNQAFLQAIAEYGILYRDMLQKLREGL